MPTYYVDVTTGADGDDGLSEGNAWQTLSKAADTVAAGDKVWVKASASYVVQDGANDCILHITTAGGGAGTPIVWEGYTTTPGDGGQVILDANTNTLASACKTAIGGSAYNIFKNIRFTGGSSHGFDGNSGADDYFLFNNCRFDNNGGDGIEIDNWSAFYKCTADNNTGLGFNGDNSLHVGSLAYSNGGTGIYDAVYGAIYCVVYNNGNDQLRVANTIPTPVIGNTIDGDNDADSIGIWQDSAASWGTIVLNNIVMSNAVGITEDNSGSDVDIFDYNLYYDNTSDISGASKGSNAVTATADPFTNSAGRDYTIQGGSEAYATGFDAGVVF